MIDGKELWYPYIHDADFTSWLDLCEKLNANARISHKGDDIAFTGLHA